MWKNNRRFRRTLFPSAVEQSVSRREVLGYAAVAGAGAAAAAVATRGANASPNYLRGLGDFRRLNVLNPRTGERLNIIYYADGEYISEAMDELNYVARDWRRDEIMPIDSRTLDISAGVYKKLETTEPFRLVSGYRSVETNNMLRRKGGGVAKNSFHTRGMALDWSLQSRSVAQMYRAAMDVRGGGVGRYTRNHFVHVDCGPCRSWGR